MEATTTSARWGLGGIIGWSLAIILVQGVIGAVALLAYLKLTSQTITKAAVHVAETNPTVITITSFAASIVCILFIAKLIQRKNNGSTIEYLAIRGVSWKPLGLWSLAVVGLVFLGDITNYLLGNPIVPEVQTTLYSSATYPSLLLVSVILVAPVFEEIFFRGFLFKSLQATVLGSSGAIVIAALAWASLHVQYDFVGMAAIFAGGLLLGLARLRTDSLLPPLAMHVINNLISSVETVMQVAAAS